MVHTPLESTAVWLPALQEKQDVSEVQKDGEEEN